MQVLAMVIRDRLSLHVVLLLVALPALAVAQASDTARRAAAASVRGVVHDSIARAPLAGAAVQLVSAEAFARFGRIATADSLGRYDFGAVPLGRYTLGFFHPVLDSLGIEAPLREVRIDGSEPVRADLAVPSAERMRSAVCGRSGKRGGVVMGVVREARDSAPAAGVAVTGEWIELSIATGGLVNRLQRLVATTGENGRFILCNVPSEGMMTLAASRGADSTDHIDMQIPAGSFLRRELYLASGSDAGRRTSGCLSGTVVAAVGGQPLAGALVSVGNGAQARANELGEWTVANVPFGTRMLEVRAIGYYPARRAVDVAEGGPPVRVSLATLKSVLDTVRVTASRVLVHDLVGFQERRRIGIGHFVTPDDIARRASLNASDIFRAFPGVKLGWAEDTLVADMTPERPPPSGPRDRLILMRGSAERWCAPMIYLDGSPLEWLNAEDIDAWVQPKDIAGIEVYTSATTPVQYQRAMNGCGAILLWRRQ